MWGSLICVHPIAEAVYFLTTNVGVSPPPSPPSSKGRIVLHFHDWGHAASVIIGSVHWFSTWIGVWSLPASSGLNNWVARASLCPEDIHEFKPLLKRNASSAHRRFWRGRYRCADAHTVWGLDPHPQSPDNTPFIPPPKPFVVAESSNRA